VTTTVKAKGARIEHQYQIFRGDELLVEGATTVACVDRQGRPTRLPKWLVSMGQSGSSQGSE